MRCPPWSHVTHANGTVVRTTSCKIAKKGSIRIAHAAAAESQEPAIAAEPEPQLQNEQALLQSEQTIYNKQLLQSQSCHRAVPSLAVHMCCKLCTLRTAQAHMVVIAEGLACSGQCGRCRGSRGLCRSAVSSSVSGLRRWASSYHITHCHHFGDQVRSA